MSNGPDSQSLDWLCAGSAALLCPSALQEHVLPARRAARASALERHADLLVRTNARTELDRTIKSRRRPSCESSRSCFESRE